MVDLEVLQVDIVGDFLKGRWRGGGFEDDHHEWDG